MRKTIIFTLFILITFMPLLSGERNYLNESFARLSFLTGGTFIQRATDVGFEEGVINAPLIAGDRLATTEGRAEVYLSRSNYLRLDEYTKVDLLHLPLPGEGGIRLNVWTGNVYLSIGYVTENNEIVIQTPDANVFILQEGLYRIDVREEEASEIFVFKGVIEVAGNEESLLLKEGQRIEVRGGEFLSRPTSFMAVAEDSFDRWNEDRDYQVRRRLAQRYLPNELEDFEYELDCHGRWTYVSPYGYVWVPVGLDPYWRPYYHGRWVWLPLSGWTWVPYESWGWVTFHFGRWHWNISLGWYWIPTTVWGPAWVSWYWGYDYIGWVPLSYYNRPIVIINNVFYDRYNYYDYPLNSRALVVVHKNQLQARNISKVVVSPQSLGKISKIRLTNQAPAIRPVGQSVNIQRLQGKKVILKKGAATNFKTISPRTRIHSLSVKSSSVGTKTRLPATSIRSRGQISSKPTQRKTTSRTTLTSPSSRLTGSIGSASRVRRSSSSRSISSRNTSTTRGIRPPSFSTSRSQTSTSRSSIQGKIYAPTRRSTSSSTISRYLPRSSSSYRTRSSSSSRISSSRSRSRSSSILGKIYNSVIKRGSSSITRRSSSSSSFRSRPSSSSRIRTSSSRASSRSSSRARSSSTRVRKKK
ncbi:MAG: hypothetical protein DRI99_02415 [Candidatus Aminicenantes bacterium]|nr:MAG: hypothetical protein DRJ11_05250 [Candidatus Aminicenantes bacterium]RLE05279.1 MAG: hypothetical protein DRI99_02415 [Candidatus Aminicenantes bacterium]